MASWTWCSHGMVSQTLGIASFHRFLNHLVLWSSSFHKCCGFTNYSLFSLFLRCYFMLTNEFTLFLFYVYRDTGPHGFRGFPFGTYSAQLLWISGFKPLPFPPEGDANSIGQEIAHHHPMRSHGSLSDWPLLRGWQPHLFGWWIMGKGPPKPWISIRIFSLGKRMWLAALK